MHDFFSNYFSFDSKIIRSAIPFFVKPGFLTNRYNEGKRSSFVHPLRLYLIVSFVFFFLLTLLIDKVVDEEKISLRADTNYFRPADEASVNPKELQAAQDAVDSLKAKLHDRDSALAQLTDSSAVARKIKETTNKWELLRNTSLTDEQIIDSLKFDKKSEVSKILIHQFRKVLQKDVDIFLPYLAKNFSLLMFLLLPIFAFYLYILFRRKEKFYISHAIHALHLHSFSFLILSLLMLYELLNTTLIDAKSVYFTAFMLVTLYAFFSIKKVYRQSWGKTFLKFNILGFFYFITLTISVMVEFVISFVLF